MASTYYFMSAPNEHGVLEWFRSQTETAEEYPNADRTLLFYREHGSLAEKEDGSPDPTASPLVSIYAPKVRKSALWTIGEVHFLWKGTKRFPALERMRKRFQSWLRERPIAWERRYDTLEGHGYYLEGSIRNWAETIYAFPEGKAAFEAGQYFVSQHDNEFVLDRVCRTLRLRGIDCG
jgi:hypothetical protein